LGKCGKARIKEKVKQFLGENFRKNGVQTAENGKKEGKTGWRKQLKGRKERKK
jgi:hypothetical protein